MMLGRVQFELHKHYPVPVFDEEWPFIIVGWSCAMCQKELSGFSKNSQKGSAESGATVLPVAERVEQGAVRR